MMVMMMMIAMMMMMMNREDTIKADSRDDAFYPVCASLRYSVAARRKQAVSRHPHT